MNNNNEENKIKPSFLLTIQPATYVLEWLDQVNLDINPIEYGIDIS